MSGMPAELQDLLDQNADAETLKAAMLKLPAVSADGRLTVVAKEFYTVDTENMKCPSGWQSSRCCKLTYNDGSTFTSCGTAHCV